MMKCPEWSEEIPPDRREEFRVYATMVYRRIDESARRKIITSDDPRAWHREMFRTFVPLGYYAGNYRQHDVSRPCLGQDVIVGQNPGMPFPLVVQEIRRLFEQFGIALRKTEILWPTLSPPERAKRFAILMANLIGGFIKIHPFLNGNGRLSRFLWAWGLIRFGVPIQCRIAPRPDPPYGQLMEESMQGNYGRLALFILQHLPAHPPVQDV